MPEKTAEKVEETARRYMREAEDVAQDAFRAGNDLMTTTINYYFDNFGKMISYTMDLTSQTQHALEEMTSIYRRIYSDSFKSWEGYLNDVNKIVIRPAK